MKTRKRRRDMTTSKTANSASSMLFPRLNYQKNDLKESRIHQNWLKLMYRNLLWYKTIINDSTIALTSHFIQQYLTHHMIPDEVTTKETHLTEALIKWMDLIVMGCMFVASKVNECRDCNPINMNHLTLYGLRSVDVRNFEVTLLNIIDWNVFGTGLTSWDTTVLEKIFTNSQTNE